MLNKIFKNEYFHIFVVGLISSFVFAPFLFFPLIFVVIPYFYSKIERCTEYKKAYMIGWLFGFGHFITGLYWISNSLLIDIHQFWFLIPFAILGIPAVLATLFIGPLTLVFFLIKRKDHLNNILIFSALWVLFEWLRAHLFTGLPWNMMGYAFGFSRYLMQIAAYGGVYIASFIIIFSSLIFVYWQKNKKIAMLVIIFYIAIFMVGYWRVHHAALIPNTEIIRIVQPNIPQDIKSSKNGELYALRQAIELSKVGNNQDIKAIIWPEAAIDLAIDVDKKLQFVKEFLLPNQILISGSIRVEKKKSLYNSLLVINSEGNILNYYDKMHLVPFGEYVPFRNLLGFKRVTNGEVDFSAGINSKQIKANHLPEFYPIICYEVIFPDHPKPKNFRWIINLTTDAWYGESTGPYQHLLKAQFRAIEQGRPLIRAASTGVSAIIDSFGQILQKIDLNVTGIIDHNIPPMLVHNTLYSILGEKSIIFTMITLLVFCLIL